MKKFFTTVLASALGTFFAISLSIILFSALIISTIMFTGNQIKNNLTQPRNQLQENTKKDYVLKIKLQGTISEHSSAKRQILNILEKKTIPYTLSSLKKLINMAKNNKKIKGIYLKINNFSASWSVIKEIQNALLEFKKSGKFIISFSQYLSEKHYLLASTADKVVLYPEGHIEWNGFHAQFTSIKELLDKLKIQIYVFRTGKFKSAVEPLLNKSISKENKTQIQNLINTMWSYLLNEISRPQVNKKVLNHLAKRYFYLSPKEALKYNLIDNIGSEWKAFSLINKKLKIKNSSATPNFYTQNSKKGKNKFQKLFSKINHLNTTDTRSGSKECRNSYNLNKKTCEANQIAILYLNGGIQDGKAQDENIGSLNTVNILRNIKKNKKIKALVLRINSPGGSALASDVIWSEIEELKKHIPVVTSISNMAASGGYYLATGSEFIFAEPSSIVGSIGVFFVRPYTAKLTEHLGIYNQNISTHNNVELFNTNAPLSPLEQSRVNRILKNTYNKFKYVIKTGRNLSEIHISDLATGRYWIGDQAVKLGLVDKIGGLKDAIFKASELAKVKIYLTTKYPQDSYFDFNFSFSLQNIIKQSLMYFFNSNFKPLSYSAFSQLQLQHNYLFNMHKLDPKGILAIMPYPIVYK